jgi:hypothetical protein
MPTTPHIERTGWRRAAEAPEALPARWDGVEVGADVALEVWLGPRSAVGSQYFRLHLVSPLGRPIEPVLFALQNAGPQPGFNWVDVLYYAETLTVDDGRTVQVPGGVERRIFEQLAGAVPPGGHLMAEYDSPARAVTAAALAADVPPLATPLGALLYAVGCGDSFRDWYHAEGGREGARKLQGFRAPDVAHARRRGIEMLAELRAFMERAAELDWELQAQTRPVAEAAIEVLSARFE